MSNKTIIVCPTFRQAEVKWKEMQRLYPDYWIKARRQPMSLTRIDGYEYIFVINHPRYLLGLHGDIVYMDEFKI